MKPYAKSLLLELERELDHVHLHHEEPIRYSEQATKILNSKIETLKIFLATYSFATTMEEIDFFKVIKPQFASKLIYYNEIFNIETNKPCGSEKILRKYYKSELEKLKTFFDDDNYFLRGEYDIKLPLDSFFFQADPEFSTSHDFKVSKIMANELIKVYLEYEYAKLDSRKIPKQQPVTNFKKQIWTAPKVSLVELIYALHAEGTFNNGASDLEEIATYFEVMFDVDLGQYNRAYLEIKARKTEKTKFIDSMKKNLLRKMDGADGII